MTSVLVHAHVDVPAAGRVTPGSGARPWEMAAALARAGLRVTLAAPNAAEAAVPPGVRVVPASPSALAGHDACVLPVAWFMGRADRPGGLVIGDVADPMLLSYAHREEDTEAGRVSFEGRIHALARCLGESDALLHAGPGAARYVAGMLSLLGRIAPGHPDPGDDLLDVPFAAPPVPEGPPPAGGTALLWASGVYPFLDAERALAIAEACSADLLVAGGGVPGGHAADDRAWRDFRARVDASPLRDRVRSIPFAPYAGRATTYEGAALSLVLARRGIEDALAWRNRVVDSLWAGVPVVLDGDDDLSRIAVGAGAALRIDRTVEAGAAAVGSLLADPGRRSSMAAAGRALAAGPLSWDAAVRPLVARLGGGPHRPGLSPRGATPLRLEPRRWGTFLHRLRVSLRLRGPAGFFRNAAVRYSRPPRP